MGLGERRTKDQEMAKRMKDEKRQSARCPICNKIISLNQLPVHIAYHPA